MIGVYSIIPYHMMAAHFCVDSQRLLARFPKARLADPDFAPVGDGAVGERHLLNLPMLIQ
jgi:hypothetical protein